MKTLIAMSLLAVSYSQAQACNVDVYYRMDEVVRVDFKGYHVNSNSELCNIPLHIPAKRDKQVIIYSFGVLGTATMNSVQGSHSTISIRIRDNKAINQTYTTDSNFVLFNGTHFKTECGMEGDINLDIETWSFDSFVYFDNASVVYSYQDC